MGDSTTPVAVNPAAARAALYFLHSAQSHCLIADDAPVGLVVGRFELRFHQADEDRARAARAGKEGGECCQADEGYVDDNEVEGCADLGGIGVLDVRALEDGHSRVLADLPGELPVVHVEGRHARGARLQQAVGEAAGGRADIQAVHAGDVLLERVQRPLKLLAAAGDELLAAANEDVGCGATFIAALVAYTSSTRTSRAITARSADRRGRESLPVLPAGRPGVFSWA